MIKIVIQFFRNVAFDYDVRDVDYDQCEIYDYDLISLLLFED